ncbi:16S rRNA (adenine(1518)-N(6)/adenine(1519)-N(6))-dimethyltransferase RsmA [Marinihelvus fidelis]|uniref:Ribosomal RNA small subunit methyltransferase A n=1 Tax=Marinihelvus fidelis TaxID=2613842 RepID=A0A5N0T8K2_9GAMM|nr:16S rRNA (adenine(1518)-N(6)/adenine(1519)-N(6))-dimethyltransferase RsmA [Marinihelvus fidelis]KAA9130477.1 16S rRNA (adenine(1518)-N(6)/adenine(1519)-N(6))-dimethyltransferase RsmA [Marinihelvus fidelis]
MNHRARKRFGQNFLVDSTVIDRIVASIAPQPGERIVEIGPGRQAITGPLIAAGADLAVVEIDRDLAASLQQRRPHLEVVCEDALKVDFSALSSGRRWRLVGNLPYNISTPLLFHVLQQNEPPVDMHFMLQKEVVDRMTAAPGGGDYGRLSLACQNLAEVTPLFQVGPEAFDPRPRVDSAVVRLQPRPSPRVPTVHQAAFDQLVLRAFSMRRKTLRNSLKGHVDPAAFEATGIDPVARPETLSLDAFAALAAYVVEQTS